MHIRNYFKKFLIKIERICLCKFSKLYSSQYMQNRLRLKKKKTLQKCCDSWYPLNSAYSCNLINVDYMGLISFQSRTIVLYVFENLDSYIEEIKKKNKNFPKFIGLSSNYIDFVNENQHDIYHFDQKR